MVSIRLILILVGQVYLVQAGTVKFGNACSVTSDCEDNKSLECLFPYVNCDKGICVCPKGHTYETDGCKATQADLFVGDDCTALDSSRIKAWNAECSGTKVTCKSSSTKVDNSFCRGTTDKLRGEECPNIFDMCYKYKDGVAASPIGITCMDVGGTKKCVCDLGYIDDGTTSCREKTVGDDCTGDSDCLKQNQECSSGSNKQCQCKSDTELSSGECQAWRSSVQRRNGKTG
ncbi:uncharacterized protein LOC135479280 isoform X2 [Liolophura sinensis]|uniref:uncharacterized protein LOC135479280 isoform X2 n=1 Tax=Liolophura sinensis TaxID=3198878 RepID=UPI00315907F8